MKCRHCDARLAVLESRDIQSHKRRRYECPNCEQRFTSYEFLVTSATQVKIGDILHQKVIRR